MKIKWILLAMFVAIWTIMLSTGCGREEDPDFITTQGMEVFDDTGRAKESEISQIVQDMLDTAPGRDSMFKNWILHLVDDPIDCGANSETGLCAGLTYTDYKIVKVQLAASCPVYCAIDHEFTHVVQWYVEETIDYDHEEPFYWDGNRGLQEVAHATSVNTVCGVDVPIPELLPMP